MKTMKYQVSESTLEVANHVAKNKWLKSLLKPLYYSYRQYLSRNRVKYFQENALNVIDNFDKALQEGGFFYTLAFGTLLGAVREKGFIKHDNDIDVFMWAEDWSQSLRDCLYKHGFEFIHGFEVDNGKLGREETYSMHGITIDIFYVYPAIDNYPYCCDFIFFPDTVSFRQSVNKHGGLIPRRLEMPFCKERVQVMFEDRLLYIPANSEELLSFRYGSDYMTPNSNWTVHSYDNHIVVWKDKIGIPSKGEE